MKQISNLVVAIVLFAGSSLSATAADYIFNNEGGYSAITFKFKHLGIAWMNGEFRVFEGAFSYDPDNVEASTVHANIDVPSLDSGHEIRDGHILEERFLSAEMYPKAKYVSSSVEDKGHGNMTVRGNFTLHGVTKEIAIEASIVGAGDDPWGGYRVGLEGLTTLDMRDFGIESFGPTHLIEMVIYIEGIDIAKAQH